ncbi:MAG: hypothetical protein GXP45_04285 [bacterium]|nr:hypothetical protein [bacterium]
MLAGTFNLIMAQRLVRTICPHCKAKTSIKDDPRYILAKKSFIDFDKEELKKEIIKRKITQEEWDLFIKEGMAYEGTGKDPKTGEVCPVCEGKKYKGRMGIFEFMEYTEDLKAMILNGKSAYEIEKEALKKGMINLERD